MSRHLVKEGNTVGWKENPTDGDYVLTYNGSNSVRWKQGPGERTALTKDGELIGWRKMFSGEVMTSQMGLSGMTETYSWGNLPTGVDKTVGIMEGFFSSMVWNPTLERFTGGWGESGGQMRVQFGVGVHLKVYFWGPYSQTIYEGDVPAGTGVTVAGYGIDNMFNVVVSNPQSNYFSHNHLDDGVMVISAVKL